MKKRVLISGSQNVKQIKNDKTRECVKAMCIDDNLFENHKKQHSMICSLYVTDNCLYKNELQKELHRKISSYYQQDRQNNFYDKEQCIRINDVIELLVSSKMKCHYCKTNVFVLYKNIRQADQWTLDRLNNNCGHNINNCVISCYKCNVQKKQMDEYKFRFTKQMKIIKHNYI